MSVEIHPTAIVSKKAEIGTNVKIGPYSIIEDNVVIGDGNEIKSHVYIASGSRIGKNNRFFSYSVIGTEPQDLKYSGAPTEAIIGNENTIREFATINRGTESTGKTIVGSNNLIMTYCHIAHDNRVGSNIVMANVAQFGGHVKIEDWVVVGGVVKVHQFCSIGCHSMIGADVKIVKDVPPYTLIGKSPAKVEGINSIGLKRRGFSTETIKSIEEFYKFLIYSGLNVSDGLAKYMKKEIITEEVRHCIEFVKNSNRGIHR